MAKHINVKLEDEQYERYRRAKDWHNLTWPEILERGVGTLDVPEQP